MLYVPVDEQEAILEIRRSENPLEDEIERSLNRALATRDSDDILTFVNFLVIQLESFDDENIEEIIHQLADTWDLPYSRIRRCFFTET